MDAWCIPKNAPNVDTAYAWIDWMIGSSAQHIICRNLVCGTVNRKTVELLDADIKAILPHNDLGSVFRNGADFDLPPLKPMGDRATLDDWERAWERVRTE
jgi:spermidine/putrescine transport system substrate-binding protein